MVVGFVELVGQFVLKNKDENNFFGLFKKN